MRKQWLFARGTSLPRRVLEGLRPVGDLVRGSPPTSAAFEWPRCSAGARSRRRVLGELTTTGRAWQSSTRSRFTQSYFVCGITAWTATFRYQRGTGELLAQ